MALNDAKIKAAKAMDRPYKLTDSNQLHLYVSTTGQRLWRMNYSVRSSPQGKPKQKTLSFGAYPAVSRSDARKARDKAKDLLRQGYAPPARMR